MKTIHSPDEILADEFGPAFEPPGRAGLVLARIRDSRLGPILAPDEFPLGPLTRIHTPAMVELLRDAHAEWRALGRPGAAYPHSGPTRGMRTDRIPASLDGRLAFHSFDRATPLTATSWQAIKASADCALTGAALLTAGERSAFALCRPPGHHAGTDHFGGRCYLNNAAIAAQKLLDDGAARIAILDLAYHHGNGTQQIFYNRADVLFISLHGHPDEEYPYLLGHEDEEGAGPGKGFNVNLPLPRGTQWREYETALQIGLWQIRAYAPDALIISLGVDTYEGGPVSPFRLEQAHFSFMGGLLGMLGLPVLFVMEGGHAVMETDGSAVTETDAGAQTGIGVATLLTAFAGA